MVVAKKEPAGEQSAPAVKSAKKPPTMAEVLKQLDALRSQLAELKSLSKTAPLGARIDRLYVLGELKGDAGKLAEAVEDIFKGLREELIDGYKKADLNGAKGTIAQFSIGEEAVPTVTDWEKVQAYIVKNKAWDLLQRRMSAKAWRDRMEAGKLVPGTEKFTKLTVSLTKIKAR